MKTFLVGVDDTPEGASVLARAVAMARPAGAKITLLHVVDVELPASKSELVRAARQHLASLAEDVPEALRGDIVVETGNPADVLCDIARERESSMVVIGAHRNGAMRRVFGTTAGRVVIQIDRPLVVVHVQAHAADLTVKRPSDELRAEHERIESRYAYPT